MAHYHGKDGKVTVLAPSGTLTAPTTPASGTDTAIGQTQAWTLDEGQELHDKTAHGDEYRSFVPGLRDWSAEVTANFDPSATVNHDELMESVMAEEFSGSLASAREVQVNLYMDFETAGSNKKAFYGAAFVERVRISSPVNGLVTAVFQLRGNGNLKQSIVLA